ncbi:hypothetical protein FCV82_16990 [Vibrio breoganii]|uniref:Uncharacterized protein n=1 Tax=Vibrio breoganii TaxID=553239 RepID=A0AAP8SVC3_9VIBR|nr:hypothetical protein [Vibrio breoganii]OED96572.1 hypothetical protein A1QG_15000 [Vibrio breoganii ZF-29]PMG36620.1 hypothetical protein BCU93_02185 [Vibrio breoganii]PMH15929.1 hypothetical protein BCU74_13260 [Vibrio breoganii]PMK54547.1 hypothetical protein BCT98_01795 [Vibrio breoganii]PMK67942.1 hypothetical protein BCT94_02710 [Vibrio breoganii]
MELIEYIFITLWQGIIAAIELGRLDLYDQTISSEKAVELYLMMFKALLILFGFYLFSICLERLAIRYALYKYNQVRQENENLTN